MKEKLENVYIYLHMLAAAVQSRMEYRGSFFIYTLTMVGFYGAQVSVIGFMLNRFRTIGGWDAGEIAFLYGLLVLAQGIVGALFAGLHDFSSFVREGTFDRVMLRPLSPLMQIITMRFEAHGVANMILGIAALVVAEQFVEINWNFLSISVMAVTVLGGAMILGAIRIMVGATAFFTVSTEGLQHLIVFSSREFLLYPIEIYSKPVKFFLTFLFPIAFINFYPAHYFLEKTSETIIHPYFIFMTFPVGLFMMILAVAYWKFGVNQYASTGT
ncbi:MAG: ABC-2 family transporter protein [Spirochaetia bacterium]|nr:ABC-2 family transporter protein [Spirochaetia bacterium]